MRIIYYSQITILLKKNINWYWETNFKAVILSPWYTHPFTPTSQKYLNELLKTDSLDWKQIYLLPRLVTLDSYSRSFQYKILNNVLYLSKKLFMFGKSASLILAFLQTFWWDSTRSILQMQYNSKSMEWTRFNLRNRIHSVWSNTAGGLFRFS